MNGIFTNTTETRLIAPGDLHELVRGEERELVERLTPVVQQENVTLDLGHVERIDAAGISALISLYGAARDAGHRFNVVNVTHHVAEILTIVGLDRILLSCRNAPAAQEECFAQPAA
jgi:anti-anti-sigma factor